MDHSFTRAIRRGWKSNSIVIRFEWCLLTKLTWIYFYYEKCITRIYLSYVNLHIWISHWIQSYALWSLNWTSLFKTLHDFQLLSWNTNKTFSLTKKSSSIGYFPGGTYFFLAFFGLSSCNTLLTWQTLTVINTRELRKQWWSTNSADEKKIFDIKAGIISATGRLKSGEGPLAYNLPFVKFTQGVHSRLLRSKVCFCFALSLNKHYLKWMERKLLWSPSLFKGEIVETKMISLKPFNDEHRKFPSGFKHLEFSLVFTASM